MPSLIDVFAGACVALAAIHAAHAAPITVALRSQATVERAQVELGEIAEIDGQADAHAVLDRAAICKAPRVDYIERLTPAMIELALRQAGVTADIRWTGAAAVQVATRTRSLSGDDILQAALSALRRTDQDGRYVFRPSHDIADVNVPVRATELRVRPLGAGALRPHTSVWVDIVADGAVYRSVQVPVDIEQDQLVLVAHTDLRAGTIVDREQFGTASLNVVGQSYVSADRLRPGAQVRLARPLHAGEALHADGILAASGVMRGDHVRVVARDGGIGIEMEGVVVHGGGNGQTVEVQVAHSAQPLSGTLLDDRTVAVQ